MKKLLNFIKDIDPILLIIAILFIALLIKVI